MTEKKKNNQKVECMGRVRNDSPTGSSFPSDEVLTAAAAGGDESAIEKLYERYRRPVYSYLNRMLNNDTMSADDIFQELWIKVINKLPEYHESGKFSAWLFRVARNQVLEHFRREKSRSKLGVLTDDGELPEQVEIKGEPYSHLAVEELKIELAKLLDQMPAEQKEVFLMRQNGLSFKEIAEIQKCPVNTALGRMHNCLKFLRQNLCR